MDCALNLGQYNKSNLLFKQLLDDFGIPLESSFLDSIVLLARCRRPCMPMPEQRAKVEKPYHKLFVQLKSSSAIMYRFTGKAARDLLLEQYKHSARYKANFS